MSKENSHTSTLFHFTKNQKTLFSILKEGLKASYCGEYFAKKTSLPEYQWYRFATFR